MSKTTGTATALSFVFMLSTVSAQKRPAATPAPVPQPAPAKPAAAPISADYRLVQGDKLRVEVYKDTQLSQSLQIRPDGKITLPLLGDIAAAGKTPTEFATR